jgi:8-oxo-dGTP pyrophosphatase MutT (NUDIX family)
MSRLHGIYQVSLKVFLKNSAGQVLVLKTPKEGSYQGFYDLPGGRIDADEFQLPFIEVLYREIREEVGNVDCLIKEKPVSLGRHFVPKGPLRDDDMQFLYVFFEGEYRGGDIEISPEHTDYEWMDLKDIPLEDYFMSGVLEGARGYLAEKNNKND